MIQTQLPLLHWEQQDNLAFYSNAKKFEVTHFLRRKFAKFLQNGNTLGGRHCFVSGLANQFFAKVPTKLIFAIKLNDVITSFLRLPRPDGEPGIIWFSFIFSLESTLAISLGG